MIDCTLSQLLLGMICFAVSLVGLTVFGIGADAGKAWVTSPYLLVSIGCMMLCISQWRIRNWLRPALLILGVALVLLLFVAIYIA